MAEDKDPFDILQVSPKASEDEIKAAYLKLARVHHPDVSSAPDAAVQFKEITEAYATVKKMTERQRSTINARNQWNEHAAGIREHMRDRMERQAASVSEEAKARMRLQVAARAASRRRSVSITMALLVSAGVYLLYKDMEQRQRAARGVASRSRMGSPISALPTPSVITNAPSAASPHSGSERR